MRRRLASLRAVLGLTMASVALLAIAVSGTLILLSNLLHRTTESAGRAVEGVRSAQAAEIDLLLHDRAADPILRRDIEGDLRRRTAEAVRLLTGDGERMAPEVQSAIDAYLTASREETENRTETLRYQQAAYGALQNLVALNVSSARVAQETAARWDRIANGIGIAVLALVLVFAASLLVWLKRRAFSPILSLAETMSRFGKGDRDARAEERGATELREMSRRFNEMASALAAQSQSQMAFLSGVAHDLKTPLTVLRLAVQSVGPTHPLPEEARLRQTLATIDRQITRMHRMLGDFSDMTRIEAGELELKVEEHDARDLVRAVVGLFDAGSTEHQLEVTLPEQAVPLRCDDLRIGQVLTNLISNATKYSPAGTTVSVAVEPTREEVVFRVTDQGIGIAPADQRRLFEPFRRVGLSKEMVPGVGLGLFIVKRIVDAHGGRIEIESALGRGSTFKVRLPAGW